jgi:hypothetical protein
MLHSGLCPGIKFIHCFTAADNVFAPLALSINVLVIAVCLLLPFILSH